MACCWQRQFIWGSAFAVVKNTLDSVPPSMMIALRFGIAALISGVILRKHLRGLTRGQVLMGLLVGVLTRAGVHCANHRIAGHNRREECFSDDDLRPAGAVRQCDAVP